MTEPQIYCSRKEGKLRAVLTVLRADAAARCVISSEETKLRYPEDVQEQLIVLPRRIGA